MAISKNSISVVIPMYNSESTILPVLESICNQTMKEYLKEIIVINDGSKDNSKKIVEEFAKSSVVRIHLINKANGGVSSARNAGMKNACGEWIAFCDSDDTWNSDKLEKQIEIINSHNVDFIGCNHTKQPLRILLRTIRKLHRADIKELCIKTFPQTSTILMKKRIFDDIGGFDENQKYAEDGDYLVKIVVSYEYYYLPETLICYGQGKRGGDSGLSANLKEMNNGTLKTLKEIYHRHDISLGFYCLMRVIYPIKYFRRLCIAKIRVYQGKKK